MKVNGGSGAMISLIPTEFVPFALVTVAVAWKVPLSVGIPEMAPVVALMVTPVGRLFAEKVAVWLAVTCPDTGFP